MSSLSISHLQALLLFLTTFCLQRYYEDALPHCLLDDCHLTLRVYRTGIISMSHKECIGFTYSFACPDAELTRTFASPPPRHSVTTAVTTLPRISVLMDFGSLSLSYLYVSVPYHTHLVTITLKVCSAVEQGRLLHDVYGCFCRNYRERERGRSERGE